MAAHDAGAAGENGPLAHAYRLLARRSYSVRELSRRLLHRGYTQRSVDRAVERLTRLNYLNDERLAADMIDRLRERGFGVHAVHAKLTAQGLSVNVERLSGYDQELASARLLLAKRYSAEALRDARVRLRAFRLLRGRGYEDDVAQAVVGVDDGSGE